MYKLTIALCLLLSSQLIWAGEWKTAKNKKGVIVETRKQEGEKFKSFRATTTIQASMDELIAFMEDVPNMINWSHNIITAKTIKEHSPGHSNIYLVQKLPMVKNRDLSLEVRIKRLNEGQYKIEITEDIDAVPANKKYVRVPKFRGSYIFTQQNPGEIQLVYNGFALPGGSIPAWLANSVVVDVPYNTLKNLRKQDFSAYKGKNKFPL